MFNNSIRKTLKKYCTLVGSRHNVPISILKMATEIGYKLYKEGYIMRSGRAIGMDRFFEEKVPNIKKSIYTTRNFDFSPKNYNFCWKEIESVMDKSFELGSYAEGIQILLLRNVNQVLGSYNTNDFMVKSRFLICWTPYTDYTKSNVGGTRFAIRIALKYGIPVFNLNTEIDKKRILAWLTGE